MQLLLSLALGVLAFLGCYLGLGLVLWLSLLIAAVCALFGVALIVIVLDGDGSPW